MVYIMYVHKIQIITSVEVLYYQNNYFLKKTEKLNKYSIIFNQY